MLILRIVVIFTALFVAGMGIAFILTRERRYLAIAWRVVQVTVLLAVAFALLYVFERVLLF